MFPWSSLKRKSVRCRCSPGVGQKNRGLEPIPIRGMSRGTCDGCRCAGVASKAVNAPVELNRNVTTESATSEVNSATPSRLAVCGNWLAIAKA